MRLRLPLLSLLFSLTGISFFLPEIAKAKSTFSYELEPVRLHFKSDSQVYASFSMPCGGRFAGFLYRSPLAGELQVAAVVERSHARCAGLNGTQERKLPLVFAERFAAISSINPSSEPQAISGVTIQNVHTTRSKQQSGVHAIYTSYCGQPMGLLVKDSKEGLAFGMLESSPSRESKASCNRSTKLYSLANLDVSRVQNPSFIKEPSDKVSTPPYSLRRVPVRLHQKATPSKPSQMHERYFHLSYLRACDEAPIGIVRKQQGTAVEVSMLVAHFPSMDCGAGRAKKVWTSWGEGLALRDSQQYRSIHNELEEPMSIVRPSSYRFGKGQKLSVKGFSACQQDIGLISRSSSQGFAVGILQSAAAKPCNSQPKQVSYELLLDPGLEVRPDIKPLQLVGQR